MSPNIAFMRWDAERRMLMDGRKDQLVDEDLMRKNASVAPPEPESEAGERQQEQGESDREEADGTGGAPPPRPSPG